MNLAETVKVEPRPIQRNVHDVAVELTHLYYENKPIGSIEELQEVYTKFYATAIISERTKVNNISAFKDLLSDDLKKILY